jgi:hypothetical protein
MVILLPETPAIDGVWDSLVTQHGVSGTPAHDARIVAAMQVHRLTSILTFERRALRAIPVFRLCTRLRCPRQ